MSKTETFFYHFIDRRPWRRMIIAAGIVGYFVISLTFLALGLALIPLRWIKSALAVEAADPKPARHVGDLTAIN